MDPRRLRDVKNAHSTGAHVGLGNISQRMQQVFGNDYAVMVETAPGAGMKVTLRVPKFVPGVRPNMPDYSSDNDTAPADVPTQSGPAQLNGADVSGVNGTRSGILPMG